VEECWIVRDGKLVGIFTERDVLLRIAGHAIDLEQAKVAEHMTRDPVTLPADASVAFCAQQDAGRRVSAPSTLVDDQGYPTAVVSMRDLIEYLSAFFNRDVLNLPPDPCAAFRNRDGA
jgi:predicted transcriptional regulator